MNASPHSDAQVRAHLAATTVGHSFVEQAVTPDDSAVSWSGTSTHPPNVTPGDHVAPSWAASRTCGRRKPCGI
jgi:hypothetical protein